VLGVLIKAIKGVPETEYSAEFLDGMVNRMAMSFFKYGAVADAYPHKVNALESLKLRIQKYQETGNTEYLIDAANFCMIEFMHPKLDNAKFEATDSDGSPGRVWNHGSVNANQNVEKYRYQKDGD
jgi:hypothetical protein